MDIKKKIQQIFNLKVNENNDDTNSESSFLPDLSLRIDPSSYEEINNFPSDPFLDQEIFEEILPEVFDDNVDFSKFHLEKLPQELDLSIINTTRQHLFKQLMVVTKKLSCQIISKEKACQEEMKRVQDIHRQIMNIHTIIKMSRIGLNQARLDFTASSLGILSAYRRRQQTKKLLNDLFIIQTMQRTNPKLQELLSENNYTEAIQLILECQKLSLAYRHFSCIRELNSKFGDILKITEEALDVSLSKICIDFKEDSYSKLYSAYELLDKTKISLDQMHMYVTKAIHSTSYNVIYGHAMLLTSSNQLKKTYEDLCPLDSSSVLPCLNDLCYALWRIMSSYKQIVNWHSHSKEKDEYLRTKFKDSLPRIWHEVQNKIKKFVLANDLSKLQIDGFLTVTDIIYKLIEVGHSFCGSQSDTLQESLQKSCYIFFQSYHQSRLDEVRMHFENEGWAICPVKASFQITHLTEFMHLKDVGFGTPVKKISHDLLEVCPFIKFNSNIMTSNELPSYKEEDFYDSENELDEQQKQNNDLPILTNTSLMLFRLTGKYLHMMKTLNSIAQTIFESLLQIFDFYISVIYLLFTKHIQPDIKINVCNSKSCDELEVKIKTFNTLTDRILTTIESYETNRNFTIKERLIAVESSIYLSHQISQLESSIDRLLPKSSREVIQEYFQNSMLAFVTTIRQPIYMGFVTEILDYHEILSYMSNVHWDIKNVESQHSDYVDILLEKLKNFGEQLIEMNSLINVTTKKMIWDVCLQFCSYILVEGFSLAKKCSNGGRALMQLDYRQFVIKMEIIADVKPIPYQDYVSNYIKAYYIPEKDLVAWMKDHTEYSKKHLLALENCMEYNKSKLKLNALIHDISGKIRR